MQSLTLTASRPPRSVATTTAGKTSTFAMSSIIFLSVAKRRCTLKPLRRKGKRPTPFERMGS